VRGLDNEDAKSRAQTVDRQGVWRDGCVRGGGVHVGMGEERMF